MNLIVSDKENVKGEPFPEYHKHDIIEDLLKRFDSLNNNLSTGKYLSAQEIIQSSGSRPLLRERLQEITLHHFNSILGKGQVNNDYKGIYIFAQKEKGRLIPVYTGISRNIVRRLKLHFCSTGKNSASWMYLIARAYRGADKNNHKSKIALLQKELAKNLYVTFEPIGDSYELYMAEAYIAARFKTYWNSFKTH